MSNMFERMDFAATKATISRLNRDGNASSERIAALEKADAERAIAKLEKDGKVIRDKPREVNKLAAMRTPSERAAYLDYIRVNYADAGPQNTEPAALELVHYGEENGIDITTDAGLTKAMAALSTTAA